VTAQRNNGIATAVKAEVSYFHVVYLSSVPRSAEWYLSFLQAFKCTFLAHFSTRDTCPAPFFPSWSLSL
jgi:hypothetical protein